MPENTPSAAPVPPSASPEAARKASEFFARAMQSERSRNWDYAVFQYTAGLQHDPDNAEMCRRLVAAGQQRRAAGGRPSTGKSAADGRTPGSAVAAAAEALAADPDGPGAAAAFERLLKAAVEARAHRVGDWAADELLRLTRSERDGSSRRARLALLADVLEARGRFEVAEQAVAEALRFAPGDYGLSRRAVDLGAKRAARDGRYGESAASGSDFTVSVRNAPAQFVRPDESAARKLAEARARWENAPGDPAAAGALAQLLLRPETDESDAEAVRVLEAAHAATGDHQFRRRPETCASASGAAACAMCSPARLRRTPPRMCAAAMPARWRLQCCRCGRPNWPSIAIGSPTTPPIWTCGSISGPPAWRRVCSMRGSTTCRPRRPPPSTASRPSTWSARRSTARAGTMWRC